MKQKMGNILVIVIGGVHHNALGVVRALGFGGVSREKLLFITFGKIEKSNFITASKFISRKNTVNCYSEDMLINLLKSTHFSIKPVVISCSDAVTEILMKHREELDLLFFLPGSEVYPGIDVMSKAIQSEIAIKSGLSIPPSFDFETKSANSDNIDFLYKSEFPCITKSVTSIDGGKESIHIANNKQELLAFLATIKASRVQIQKYIDKKIEFQLIGVSLDSGSKVIIPGYTQMIRQPQNTNTGYLRYSPILELDFDISKVYTFIKNIKYSGLFSVEFLRDKLGNDYFMEINMRNDGNALVVTKAGVNLPYIWYIYNTLGHADNLPMSFSKSIYFMPEIHDVKNVLNGEVTLIQWLKDLWQAKAKAVWDVKDPMPFFKMITNKILKR